MQHSLHAWSSVRPAGGAQAAKGVREKEAKVQRELETGPRPPEDPVAHQLQEIEVLSTEAALICGMSAARVPAHPDLSRLQSGKSVVAA
jgi:hypothetical protein